MGVDDVVTNYAAGGELTRIGDVANLLEWERTCELLFRWLPAAPTRILDVGGGPAGKVSFLSSLAIG